MSARAINRQVELIAKHLLAAKVRWKNGVQKGVITTHFSSSDISV